MLTKIEKCYLNVIKCLLVVNENKIKKKSNVCRITFTYASLSCYNRNTNMYPAKCETMALLFYISYLAYSQRGQSWSVGESVLSVS